MFRDVNNFSSSQRIGNEFSYLPGRGVVLGVRDELGSCSCLRPPSRVVVRGSIRDRMVPYGLAFMAFGKDHFVTGQNGFSPLLPVWWDYVRQWAIFRFRLRLVSRVGEELRVQCVGPGITFERHLVLVPVRQGAACCPAFRFPVLYKGEWARWARRWGRRALFRVGSLLLI